MIQSSKATGEGEGSQSPESSAQSLSSSPTHTGSQMLAHLKFEFIVLPSDWSACSYSVKALGDDVMHKAVTYIKLIIIHDLVPAKQHVWSMANTDGGGQTKRSEKASKLETTEKIAQLQSQ